VETKVPNPGSPEAIAQGCKCPVVQNNFGRGIEGIWSVDGDPYFAFELDCPLHGSGEWHGE
jgi:hypothetical protein